MKAPEMQETQTEERGSAYITLNGNEVEYSIEIEDDVFADFDEDSYLVGLELRELNRIPSFEDIEYVVDMYDDDQEEFLKYALEELGAYSRIRKYFGN